MWRDKPGVHQVPIPGRSVPWWKTHARNSRPVSNWSPGHTPSTCPGVHTSKARSSHFCSACSVVLHITNIGRAVFPGRKRTLYHESSSTICICQTLDAVPASGIATDAKDHNLGLAKWQLDKAIGTVETWTHHDIPSVVCDYRNRCCNRKRDRGFSAAAADTSRASMCNHVRSAQISSWEWAISCSLSMMSASPVCAADMARSCQHAG